MLVYIEKKNWIVKGNKKSLLDVTFLFFSSFFFFSTLTEEEQHSDTKY